MSAYAPFRIVSENINVEFQIRAFISHCLCYIIQCLGIVNGPVEIYLSDALMFDRINQLVGKFLSVL